MAVHKLHPRKTAVLALAFCVDTSRHEPAEDHEIAFWCMPICIRLRFAFPTMEKKSDPQAGDFYVIRDLRMEQCWGCEFEVWEIYLSLLFSSSPSKPGVLFFHSLGKYTCQLLFHCFIYIYIQTGQKKLCKLEGMTPKPHGLSVCFVCCAFTLPPFKWWLRCMEEFLAAGQWSVGY